MGSERLLFIWEAKLISKPKLLPCNTCEYDPNDCGKISRLQDGVVCNMYQQPIMLNGHAETTDDIINDIK